MAAPMNRATNVALQPVTNRSFRGSGGSPSFDRRRLSSLSSLSILLFSLFLRDNKPRCTGTTERNPKLCSYTSLPQFPSAVASSTELRKLLAAAIDIAVAHHLRRVVSGLAVCCLMRSVSVFLLGPPLLRTTWKEHSVFCLPPLQQIAAEHGRVVQGCHKLVLELRIGDDFFPNLQTTENWRSSRVTFFLATPTFPMVGVPQLAPFCAR